MNTVSPVTESEVGQVQTFFERISTTIMAHAAQVRELQELRTRVADIDSRLNSLQSESENLRRDLTQAWEYNARLEQEKNNAVRDAAEQREYAAKATQETAQVRQEYEQKLAALQASNESKDRAVVELQERLYALTNEVSTWRERSGRYESMAQASEDKLRQVQAKFDDMASHVRSLFEPKPETEEGRDTRGNPSVVEQSWAKEAVSF